ncbi:MAG TPA: Zn-dependent hydrolase, partial [Bryobacteraceae bacterium]
MSIAQTVVDRCRTLAAYSEEPGFTTRTFLSEPMHAVHGCVRSWMERAGMTVHVDHAGNVRGLYRAERERAPRLLIGSHLDTVPRAGAFDGVLGVVLGVALVEI